MGLLLLVLINTQKNVAYLEMNVLFNLIEFISYLYFLINSTHKITRLRHYWNSKYNVDN